MYSCLPVIYVEAKTDVSYAAVNSGGTLKTMTRLLVHKHAGLQLYFIPRLHHRANIEQMYSKHTC